MATRAVEARSIAPLIRALSRKMAWDDALGMLMEVNRREASHRGRHLAEEIGRNVIEELVDEVAGWGGGGAWGMDVLQQASTVNSLDVTRSPHHEKHLESRLLDLGAGLSCCRDEPLAREFNPRLRLGRTTAITEAADHCDSRNVLRQVSRARALEGQWISSWRQ